MNMTRQRINRIRQKIQASRTRLMMEKPFFALLLMNINFYATNRIKTISTDGVNIFFAPDYIDKLYTEEMDFLLCHIVLHIVFDDISRPIDLEGNGYHHACDMINNEILTDYGYTNGRYPHLGEIYSNVSKWLKDTDVTPLKLFYALPYNISQFDETIAKRFMIDTDEKWGKDCILGEDTLFIIGPEENPEATRAKNVKESGKSGGNGGAGNNSADMVDEPSQLGNLINSIIKMLNGKQGIGVGGRALFEKRDLLKIRKTKNDWKSLLIDFVQEEILDYSFTPPDRRFDDSPFFLPDFNVPDEKVKDILFMIDTSGSMSNEMITAAYSEIKGAIEQFDGKLVGWVGFFDSDIIEPVRFESIDEFQKIEAYGGGGTSFDIIFDYVKEFMTNNPPASIIILTDGFADFPDKECAMDIPVLWCINNDMVNPPWGRVVRIKL